MTNELGVDLVRLDEILLEGLDAEIHAGEERARGHLACRPAARSAASAPSTSRGSFAAITGFGHLPRIRSSSRKDGRTREKWLPGVEWKARTSVPDKSIRVTWEDGASVEFYFMAKGDSKSQLAIEHRKLKSRKEAEKAKAF